MKQVIERLKQVVTHIQALRLANEDDEKYRDWAIHDISETVTQLVSMELGAPYKEVAYGHGE
jgi:nitrogen-specific signal transduction histidine kinase